MAGLLSGPARSCPLDHPQPRAAAASFPGDLCRQLPPGTSAGGSAGTAASRRRPGAGGTGDATGAPGAALAAVRAARNDMRFTFMLLQRHECESHVVATAGRAPLAGWSWCPDGQGLSCRSWDGMAEPDPDRGHAGGSAPGVIAPGPAAMPVTDRLAVPEVPGQVPPRAPGPVPEEDPADHQPAITPPAPLPRIAGQQRLQPRPLLISGHDALPGPHPRASSTPGQRSRSTGQALAG